MDLGLEGKVALVAGASKGLGRAVALGLAREGVSLALCARSDEQLSEAASAIAEETGATVWTRPTDVSSPEESRLFVREAYNDACENRSQPLLRVAKKRGAIASGQFSFFSRLCQKYRLRQRFRGASAKYVPEPRSAEHKAAQAFHGIRRTQLRYFARRRPQSE